MGSLQIISTAPEEIVLPRRTYRVQGWRIPACSKENPFTSIVVDDQMDERIVYTEYDYTKGEHIPVPVPASQVTTDYFSNERLAQRGCFTLPAGEIPTEAQIEAARGTRRAWLQTLVQVGDAEFLNTGRVDQIPDFCKRAVAELGVEREWAFVAPAAMVDCPVCGDKVKIGVALCRSCGAILDREKAEKYGVIERAQGPHLVPQAKDKKPRKEIEGI